MSKRTKASAATKAKRKQAKANAQMLDGSVPLGKEAKRFIRGVMKVSAERRPKMPSQAPTSTPPGPMRDQGADGVASVGGVIVAGERNFELFGSNIYTTYGELIAGVVIVAAYVRYALNLIRGVEWELAINPRCPDRALAEKCLETGKAGFLDADRDSTWEDDVAKQALGAAYGFSLHSWKQRKRSDGLITYADIGHRPQYQIKRWDIPQDGAKWRGVWQETPSGGLYYLQRSRLWYFGDRMLTDRPTGVGLLRHVVEHCRRLQNVEKIEGYAVDANLRGVPIVKAPLGKLRDEASKTINPASGKVYKGAEIDAYVKAQTSAVESFLVNHIKTADQGLLLDSAVYTGGTGVSSTTFSGIPEWTVELLTGDDGNASVAGAIIERLNREIARVFGFEWALMAGEGSYAQHVDKTAQTGAQLNGIVRSLAASARNDLLRPLIAANHGAEAAEEATPLLVPSPISTGDILAHVQSFTAMVHAGAYAPPDDPAWATFRKRMNLPEAPKMKPGARGTLPMIPRDPNDPNDPRNGGDGAPLRPGETEIDENSTPGDANDLRQGGEPAKRRVRSRRVAA